MTIGCADPCWHSILDPGRADLGRSGRGVARWDGSCAYKGAPGSAVGPIIASDVVKLRDFVAASGGSTDGFDIKISGGDDPAVLDDLEQPAATWWVRVAGCRSRSDHRCGGSAAGGPRFADVGCLGSSDPGAQQGDRIGGWIAELR